MPEFVTGLIEALRSRKFVVLGDRFHGATSFDSIVEALRHERGRGMADLLDALRDTQILLENVYVGEAPPHRDVVEQFRFLAELRIPVGGCEPPEMRDLLVRTRNAEREGDLEKVNELGAERLRTANKSWKRQACLSRHRGVVLCCGTSHVPRCTYVAGGLCDKGMVARLFGGQNCAGYAVDHTDEEYYTPEKDDTYLRYEPVRVLSPFEEDDDDGDDDGEDDGDG